jgi:FkbM family methyltransferase
MDLIDLSGHVTRRLPAGLGEPLGYHLGARARRKTRLAHVRTGGRVAADVGDHLHRTMFFRGVYEPAVTKFLESIARPGWTVIDVGANVGYFAVTASDLGGEGSRILAFEPDPRLGAMLEHTARANPSSKIMVDRSAVSDRPGKAIFHPSPEERNSGLGSLRPDQPETRPVTVPVVRLDTACQERGLRPDLVKIDVEGFEVQVLDGSGFLLSERVPAHFLIEVSPQRQDPGLIISRLAHYGYQPWQICDTGALRPIGEIRHIYEDLVFTRVP